MAAQKYFRMVRPSKSGSTQHPSKDRAMRSCRALRGVGNCIPPACRHALVELAKPCPPTNNWVSRCSRLAAASPFAVGHKEVVFIRDNRNRIAGMDLKKKTLQFGRGFKVLIGNRRVQAAQMVIAPGHSEGGPTNRHRESDQWLFVVSGKGTAIVSGRRHVLKRYSLLLIEHGERHEIRNTGQSPLKTLNLYSPPGYAKEGNELPRAKP
jgi:mannose-6-phosphate isomerase-like protein (cupin superfamily)